MSARPGARAPRGGPGTAPEATARLFKVLGDPTRLRILQALRDGDRSVSELVSIVGAPQSRISNHLACLKWCRLVGSERDGRRVLYRLNSDVGSLLQAGGRLASAHEEYLASCTRIGPDWV